MTFFAKILRCAILYKILFRINGGHPSLQVYHTVKAFITYLIIAAFDPFRIYVRLTGISAFKSFPQIKYFRRRKAVLVKIV